MDNYTIQMQVTLDDSGKKELQDTVAKAAGTGLKDGVKDFWNGFKTMIKNDAVNLVGSIVNSIKQLFKDAINEMSEMLDYSQLSSAHTRELAFGYGFSSSEAYGWDKAMSMLGFQSEEDLFYANTQELQQFREAFEKYSNYYNELYDSGFFEQLQEYQFEMQDFKNEVQMQIVQFFMDNKDTIMAAMRAILTIADSLLKFISLFTGTSSNYAASTSDIINQYTTTNSPSNTATLNVTNTFNNADSSISSQMSNEVESEYRLVIQALGGN